jgi:hypothetical protein
MGDRATQYPDLPVGVGMDTATAPELVAPGKALSVRNVHLGDDTLRRRSSYEQKTRVAFHDTENFGKLAKPAAIFPIGDSVGIATDDSRVYTDFTDLLTTQAWMEVERNDAPVSFKRALHSAVGAKYKNPNIAITSDGEWACVTWWNEGAGYATIYNLVKGVVRCTTRIVAANVSIGTPASAGSNPGLVPVANGTRFVVFYNDNSANFIKSRVFAVGKVDADWGAEQNVAATTLDAVEAFDACSDGATFFLAYAAATTGILTAKRGSYSTGSQVITHTVTYSGVPTAIAISKCEDFVCIAYALAAGDISAKVASSATLASAGTALALSATATSVFKSIAVCCYQTTTPDGASTENRALVVCTDASSTSPYDAERYGFTSRFWHVSCDDLEFITSPAGASEPGVSLCHRPFQRRGLSTLTNNPPLFVGLRRNQDLEDTYYTYIEHADVLAWSPEGGAEHVRCVRTPVARYSALTAAYVRDGGQPDEQGVSAVASDGAHAWYWVGVEHVDLQDGGAREVLTLYTCDFDPDKCWQATEINGTTLLAGSLTRMVSPEALVSGAAVPRRGLDGTVPMHSPPAPILDDDSGGGDLVAATTYHYVQQYEYTDIAGRKHRGPPSASVAHLTGGGVTAIEITSPPFDAPQPGYAEHKLVTYRTEGNPSEMIFYRLREDAPTGGVNTDDTGDSDITDNEILYTVSGELANAPPPPALAAFLWKNRIVVLDSETGKLWPSKTIIDGEWPGWHEGLAVSCDVHTRLPKYASAEGDSIVVWWSDAIGVVYGDPGTDTGIAGNMTQPKLLSARGIGLKYVKSLVVTPLGQMFMSERGIYLLGADLSLNYIGRDIEAYNGFRIVGAVVVGTEVRFYTDEQDDYADGYVTLVYDWHVQKWHVHTFARAPSCAAVVNGEPYVGTAHLEGTDDPWAEEPGISGDKSGVWREDSTITTRFDALTLDIKTRFASAWYKLAGLLGAQHVRRLWLLGELAPEDGATVKLETRRDFDEDAAEVANIAADRASRKRVEQSIGDPHECGAMRFDVIGFKRLIGMRAEVEAEKTALRRDNHRGT